MLNGLFRQHVLNSHFSVAGAKRISTLLLLLLLGVYIFLMLNRYPPKGNMQALAAGSLWAALTVMFEIGIGLRQKLSLNEMLADYNIFRGRLWSLVIVFLLFSPLIYHLFMQ